MTVPILGGPKIIHWTWHSRDKMRYYRLSEARVRRILHSPARIEEGVAPKTAALMQKAGSAGHPHELWVMIQDVGRKRKVISAWRYPGESKPRSVITLNFLAREYGEYLETEPPPAKKTEAMQRKIKSSRWFRPASAGTKPTSAWRRPFRPCSDKIKK